MPSKIWIRCAFSLAGLALLCSCASTRKAPSAPVATTPEFKTERTLVALPISLAPQEPSVKITSRSEEISQLVRAGTLIETGKESLVFCLSRPPRNSPGGLFEDAIVLNRLRGQLKKVPGLPDSVRGTATVQSAKAYLKLTDPISTDLAARAIDAALKTDGVTVVHVTTAPEARL